VLTGGLIHLVHQLAVLEALPESAASGGGSRCIAVLVTGVLTRDPLALSVLQEAIKRWFTLLRQHHPERYGHLVLIAEEASLPEGPWHLCLLNNQWVVGQRSVIERLDLRDLVVCGDGLGLYYRCARELRALLPSLLNRPIAEPGRRVRYGLSGPQPLWHRPPQPALGPSPAERTRLFGLLVDSQRREASASVAPFLAAGDPSRPLWLCSVPNLAHQFPGRRIPTAVLEGWLAGLERRHGFDRLRDRLLLIDHPKAPPDGSFGAVERAWLVGPLRSMVALEVLVQVLLEASPKRRIVVAGLTSALYGVRQLTGVEVVWFAMAPLWQGNPLYRRQPLEFVHRWLRRVRMARLTRGLEPGQLQ
jgi:hypothetical protein